MRRTVSLTVNGRGVEAAVEPRTHLAELLRDDLLLTGTHLGCEHGVCGACTVMIDGAPARSCIAFALACDGADVRTIEGFPDDPLMTALRAAFHEHHALQCGYCTPGMLITAYDVVRRLPGADEARIREELAGNLCRCTGYAGIVRAIGAVLASPPAAPALPRPAAPAPSARRFPSAAPVPRARSPAPTPAPTAGPGGPARLTRRIELPIAPAPAWALLRDVEVTVACLPGAELLGPPEPDPDGIAMRLRLSAGVGPMRAAFAGRARAVFDDHTRRAALTGEVEDAASRTCGTGRIDLALEPLDGARCAVVLAIGYDLRGPLAWFGRGAVVEATVDELLARFAENVAARALGREPTPDGGVWAALRALVRRLRARRID